MWAINQYENGILVRELSLHNNEDNAQNMATRLTMQAPKGVTYAVVEVTNLEFG